MFQLFQLFQILSQSHSSRFFFFPSLKKEHRHVPTQTTKKKEGKRRISVIPIPDHSRIFRNSRCLGGGEAFLLLGRKTQNLVRVRRTAVSVSFSVIEGEERRVIVVIVVVFGQGKNARLHE